jgi:membrane-associated phospholipid phosphatase
MRPGRLVVVLGIASLAAGPGLAATPAGRDSLAPPLVSARAARSAHPLVLAAASVAGIGGAALADRWSAREFPNSRGWLAGRLAALGEHLGNPLYAIPVLGSGYAFGRLSGRPGLAAGAARTAGAVLGAGVMCEALKVATGRARPRQAPDDPDDFRPFRGDVSFPSGHATIAFALASSLDQETGARWVPWVAYPAAALTAWSRVRDREHWLSDVVAGAALGTWAGGAIDRYERSPGPSGLRLFFKPSRRGARVGLRARF